MAQAAPPESKPEMVQLEIRKGADAELSVGGLRLVACRREVGDFDGGITLYIWNDTSNVGGNAGVNAGGGGKAVELVRMDLFRDRPHYHAPAENQAEVVIESGDSGTVAWGIEALTKRAPALAEEAGFGEIGAALDQAALAAAGPAIQSLFDGLAEPTEISYFEVPAAVLESLKG